ncbi:MAG: MBOAT family O-acyltransferase [Halioglobus sp.]|nr:MBOAT family O-acyltransferase [Halioglobus sp.]
MSYIIDAYRRETPMQRRFSSVALYISLFPQLIAGPIVRYHDIARQIVTRDADATLTVSGIRRFLIGLAKKMLIANPMGQAADTVFALPETEVSFALAWFGILCYALQIYFDFSGYSDMAIGLGRMFGFRFLENFNYPYTARSLQDFWRRWHISLSSWFRDYLYIPLGGNRVGPLRTYVNLFAVFFLCGLWHGASWNFVLWGIIHGWFLVLERAGLSGVLARLWWPLQHAYTLLVVCIAWVFFRAEELPQALSYVGAMLGLGDASPIEGGLQMLMYAPDTFSAFLFGLLFSTPVYLEFSRRFAIPLQVGRPVLYMTTQTLFIVALFFLVLLAVVSTTYNPFIYFRF